MGKFHHCILPRLLDLPEMDHNLLIWPLQTLILNMIILDPALTPCLLPPPASLP